MTPQEAILARVALVLDTAKASLGLVGVERRRIDARNADELPACEITRGAWEGQPFGDGGLRGSLTFTLALIVLESAQAEAELDALHQKAHVALHADAVLPTLGKGLICTGTEEPEQVASGEGEFARMTATYQIQTLTRRADLARAL